MAGRRIPAETIAEAERLLAAGGLSHRAVAQSIGISRGTVARVAAGTWTEPERRKRHRRPQGEGGKDGFQGPDLSKPKRRCAVCGATIYPPCQKCQLDRELKRVLGSARPRPFETRGDYPLPLELRGEARERYEALHREKVLAQSRGDAEEVEADEFGPTIWEEKDDESAYA